MFNGAFYTHINILTGNVNVHAPETGDQVHGNENRTQRGQLRQNVVDLIVRVCHLD